MPAGAVSGVQTIEGRLQGRGRQVQVQYEGRGFDGLAAMGGCHGALLTREKQENRLGKKQKPAQVHTGRANQFMTYI